MSFRPRPQLLNLGVVGGRPRLGPSRGQTNELFFSQLFIPTKSATRTSTRKSRFSSTTSTPLSHHHHHHSPPRSHQYHQHHHLHQQQQQTRHNSTHSNPNPSNPNPKDSKDSNSTTNNPRITRLLSRLPRFLHPYLSSLHSSPSSFVVAFLILHEITAILPGLGFFYLFHYCGGDEEQDEDKDKEGVKEGGTDKDKEGKSYGKRFEAWVMKWMMELGYSEVMVKKMEGFERWFRRKGYFGFGMEGNKEGEEGEQGEERGKNGDKKGEGEGEERQKEQVLMMMKKWQSGGDEKYRVLVDAALAYAITKALLPVRIIASVQATPWFAGVLGRVRRVFSGGLRK